MKDGIQVKARTTRADAASLGVLQRLIALDTMRVTQKLRCGEPYLARSVSRWACVDDRVARLTIA